MFSYSVFGGVLRSEIALDGVRPTAIGPANWTFRLGEETDPVPGSFIGEERLTPALSVALYRSPIGGLRLRYDALDIGDFRISADGSEIAWTPGEDPPIDQLRWILLGRVMALSLYLSGTLCLHGSGVALEHGAVAFLAPKHHGKSTLAAALVTAGAALVSDDVVPVETGPRVRVRPGVHSIRLWEPRLVDGLGGRADTTSRSGKVSIDGLPGSRLMLDPEPLRAVYVLNPVEAEPEPGLAAAATQLAPVPAFEMLIRHSSIGQLLDVDESRLLFSRAAAIAAAVPVLSLRIVRDLARLPEVVELIGQWHAGSRNGTPAGARLPASVN